MLLPAKCWKTCIWGKVTPSAGKKVFDRRENVCVSCKVHKGPLDSPVNTFNIEGESEDAEEIGTRHKRLLISSDSLSYNAIRPGWIAQ